MPFHDPYPVSVKNIILARGSVAYRHLTPVILEISHDDIFGYVHLIFGKYRGLRYVDGIAVYDYFIRLDIYFFDFAFDCIGMTGAAYAQNYQNRQCHHSHLETSLIFYAFF